jgi:hypothetical protein
VSRRIAVKKKIKQTPIGNAIDALAKVLSNAKPAAPKRPPAATRPDTIHTARRVCVLSR